MISSNQSNPSRVELLEWIRVTTGVPISDIKELASGVHFCHLLHHYTGGKFTLKKMDRTPRQEITNLHNLKLLDVNMGIFSIGKKIDIKLIAEKQPAALLEILQWWYKQFKTPMNQREVNKPFKVVPKKRDGVRSKVRQDSPDDNETFLTKIEKLNAHRHPPYIPKGGIWTEKEQQIPMNIQDPRPSTNPQFLQLAPSVQPQTTNRLFTKNFNESQSSFINKQRGEIIESQRKQDSPYFSKTKPQVQHKIQDENSNSQQLLFSIKSQKSDQKSIFSKPDNTNFNIFRQPRIGQEISADKGLANKPEVVNQISNLFVQSSFSKRDHQKVDVQKTENKNETNIKHQQAVNGQPREKQSVSPYRTSKMTPLKGSHTSPFKRENSSGSGEQMFSRKKSYIHNPNAQTPIQQRQFGTAIFGLPPNNSGGITQPVFPKLFPAKQELKSYSQNSIRQENKNPEPQFGFMLSNQKSVFNLQPPIQEQPSAPEEELRKPPIISGKKTEKEPSKTSSKQFGIFMKNQK